MACISLIGKNQAKRKGSKVNWNKGLSASYYAGVVDAKTWRDLERFEITGGSITFKNDGLRNAADIDCVNYDKKKEVWVRIRLDARQGGERTNIPLFTGLASVPDRDINGVLVSNTIKCYSVLQPCEDVLLPRGWYALEGTNAEIVIKDLLSVTPAPVIFDGVMPNLAESIVAEEGENHLTMMEKVLIAIGWRLKINGMGEIVFSPYPTKEAVTFDAVKNDCIQTRITESYDWHSAPNVFRAISEDNAVTYKDESDGLLSISSRGREIWMEETGCNLSDRESLEGYAKRRLEEEQHINHTLSYTRRFIPDLYPNDIARLVYPKQKIDGLFSIVSQTISIGYGAPVSEEVKGI